jgi:hypothetical protein
MQAALAPSGYSGTPLPAKLGLEDGMVAAFVALPQSLERLTAAVQFIGLDRPSAWSEIAGSLRKYDCIHAFTRQRAEIATHLASLQDAIKPDGMIWVSWPKLDLVDVKVAAIDETWSGLKLVIRKERQH